MGYELNDIKEREAQCRRARALEAKERRQEEEREI